MSVAHAPDGAAIAYEVHGEGPSLVLVHGITDSRRAWDPLVAGLAADHRVVAVDLRGHGESDRQPPYDVATMTVDMHAVVEASGVTDPLLIGHSLGGVVVALYASTYPVRGVIDVDQPLQLGGFKELLMSLEPMLRGDEDAFQAVVHDIFVALMGPLPEAEQKRLSEVDHPEQDVVLGIWDAVLTSSAADLDALMGSVVAAIPAPFLEINGADAGADYERWLTANLRAAAIETWSDHGHYPHLVDPNRFLARVRDFELRY
jgi:pimeloyl-ACP methyl ester carboxylesterase